MINGEKILLKGVDEYKLGWKYGDKITVYVDPTNKFHVYTSRNSRGICFISLAVTSVIAGKIIIEAEMWRRKKNPNWFEEDREKEDVL